jgi:hypothetical protein
MAREKSADYNSLQQKSQVFHTYCQSIAKQIVDDQ